MVVVGGVGMAVVNEDGNIWKKAEVALYRSPAAWDVGTEVLIVAHKFGERSRRLFRLGLGSFRDIQTHHYQMPGLLGGACVTRPHAADDH